MSKYLNIISKISDPKITQLGGKGVSLTLLSSNGFPVPNGLILKQNAYLQVLKFNNIQDIIENLTKNVNERNYKDLSKKFKDIILQCTIPESINKELANGLKNLEPNNLSVRSSATSEDSIKESFAGLYDSFLNVPCKLEIVLFHIKKCWASIFNERSVIYRIKKGISLCEGMAVIVQEMVNSNISGIVFTQHPSQKRVMLIESAYGLGNLVVGGEISPDSFIISRKNLSIMDTFIGSKSKMCRGSKLGKLEVVTIPTLQQNIPSISTHQLKELCNICLKIDNLFNFPQDIEWAIYKNNIYILQSRPITTIIKFKKAEKIEKISRKNEIPFLVGIPASSGIVKGNIKVIKNTTDIYNVTSGEIIVTSRVTPSILSAIDKLAGIISEEGSIVSHAAIIAREFMIPCVVGVENATQILSDNIIVELDGVAGKIYFLNHELNVDLSLSKELGTKLNINESKQEKVVNLPKLEDITDINQLVGDRKIILSPMGEKVVQTFNFVNKWRSFIRSLRAEKIYESWRDTLGEFLAVLVGINKKDISIDFLDELVSIHNNFYMYNLLADCYDPYPLFRQIVNKYTVQRINSRIIENLIDYSIEYKIPFNQLKSSIYIPLLSRYIPIGMHRTEDVSCKKLLIELGRAYTLDRTKYIDMLSKLELGELDALNLTNRIPKTDNIRKYANEIFLNVLPNKTKEEFKLCIELIEHFGIMNDINRLVGKEFAEEAKKVVDSLKCFIDVDFESGWPWEQLLILYMEMHRRRDKLEKK